MNDEPPQLGGGLRGELSCEEGGRVQVTVDYLSATDRDSDDSRLTYMLARSPGRGELQRAGLTVDKFSQQDLLQGHIYYSHTGEDVTPVSVWSYGSYLQNKRQEREKYTALRMFYWTFIVSVFIGSASCLSP